MIDKSFKKKSSKEFWKTPRKAGDIIDSFFSSQKMLGDYRLAQIGEIWQKAVGDDIFKSTELIEISNRKLRIELNNVEIYDKIEQNKRELIKSVNEMIGKNILVDIIVGMENQDGS